MTIAKRICCPTQYVLLKGKAIEVWCKEKEIPGIEKERDIYIHIADTASCIYLSPVFLYCNEKLLKTFVLNILVQNALMWIA